MLQLCLLLVKKWEGWLLLLRLKLTRSSLSRELSATCITGTTTASKHQDRPNSRISIWLMHTERVLTVLCQHSSYSTEVAYSALSTAA
jgi:hypothetical protein